MAAPSPTRQPVLLDAVLLRLDNLAPASGPKHWIASCPSHNDERPSLDITVAENGRLLWYCRAGCSQDAVRTALGLDGFDTSQVVTTEGEIVVGATSRSLKGDVPSDEVAALATDLDQWNVALLADGPDATAVRAYAATRWGLDRGGLVWHGLGLRVDSFGAQLVVPTVAPDGLRRGWQARSVTGAPEPRWCSPKAPSVGAWESVGVLRGRSGHPEVLVTEGPGDGLAAAQAGFTAVAILGAGRTNDPDVIATVAAHVGDAPVVLVGDNDDAGRHFNATLATGLRAQGVTDVRVLEIPTTPGLPVNDLSVWASAVRATGGDWPEVLADAIDQDTGDRPAGSDDRTPDSARELELQHTGQVKAAYRLAATNKDKLLHVHGLGWFYWDLTRWAPDDKGVARRAVLDVLRDLLAESLGDREKRRDVERSETASGVTGILAIAASLEQFAATVDDLDVDPYLLNCANGTLDLQTLELRPASPADRITRITNATYRPEIRSADWERFLAEVLPDTEVREYVQRLIGLSLLGAVREHVLAILTGTGANGKSTFYESVAFALGEYAHQAERDLFMASSGGSANSASPAVFSLRGKRLVIVSETEQDHALAAALMKNLTGGDPITARPLYNNPVTFTPSHTPLMVTNYLPKVAGDDAAVFRRLRVIRFVTTIPDDKQDPLLGERLRLEAEAILAWAVEGWAAYYRTGKLTAPQAVLVATNDYRLASDAVARFITEACEVGDGYATVTKPLFRAWNRWRLEDGADEMSEKVFGAALDLHGYPTRKGTGGQRVRRGIQPLDRAIPDPSDGREEPL